MELAGWRMTEEEDLCWVEVRRAILANGSGRQAEVLPCEGRRCWRGLDGVDG